MFFTKAKDLLALFFAIYFALLLERSNDIYKPWDTYNACQGKTHNIKRLVAAWILLFAVPLLHFAILFTFLGSINIQFDMTISGISNVVLIGLSSFFDFGYFRIYEAFLHSYPESFFSDEDVIQIDISGKIRPDFWAHFMPGALYVIISVLMMMVAIYY